MRYQAEIDNYRKRQQRLADERVSADRARLLRAFLQVGDDLERALKADGADADNLRKGIALTRQTLVHLLESEGVEPMEAEGQPFDDLHTTIPVSLYTAVLGGKVRAKALSGPVKLTIPAGTQNGGVFRLRGKGMPRLRSSKQHGDLYAPVDVQLPTHLTRRQKELFEALRRESGEAT